MIYLDNASTTYPKPPEVAAAVAAQIADVGVSPGRGEYAAARRAERVVDECRRAVAALLGAESPDRIAFFASCTDALNAALKGSLSPGDHVVTTELEHNSVLRPLHGLAEHVGVEVSHVPFSTDGFVNPDDIAAAFRPHTRLVVLNHASNVLGTIQNAEAIGKITRERDALFLLDAAQTVGVVDMDVAAWNIDILAWPAHKALLGPAGLGGLYVGPRTTLRPWREGGTGGDSASPHQPPEMPVLLEAGTPNTPAIAGLAAALQHVRPADSLAHERHLLDRLRDGVDKIPDLNWLGTRNNSTRVGTVSVHSPAIPAPELAAILDDAFDIAVRAGLHCAPRAHDRLGTAPDGAVRISPGPYSTAADIDALLDALRQIFQDT